MQQPINGPPIPQLAGFLLNEWFRLSLQDGARIVRVAKKEEEEKKRLRILDRKKRNETAIQKPQKTHQRPIEAKKIKGRK